MLVIYYFYSIYRCIEKRKEKLTHNAVNANEPHNFLSGNRFTYQRAGHIAVEVFSNILFIRSAFKKQKKTNAHAQCQWRRIKPTTSVWISWPGAPPTVPKKMSPKKLFSRPLRKKLGSFFYPPHQQLSKYRYKNTFN